MANSFGRWMILEDGRGGVDTKKNVEEEVFHIYMLVVFVSNNFFLSCCLKMANVNVAVPVSEWTDRSLLRNNYGSKTEAE